MANGLKHFTGTISLNVGVPETVYTAPLGKIAKILGFCSLSGTGQSQVEAGLVTVLTSAAQGIIIEYSFRDDFPIFLGQGQSIVASSQNNGELFSYQFVAIEENIV